MQWWKLIQKPHLLVQIWRCNITLPHHIIISILFRNVFLRLEILAISPEKNVVFCFRPLFTKQHQESVLLFLQMLTHNQT